MKELVARFGKAVKAVLTGFDRIVFKGTILPLAHEEGAMSFLGWRGVLNRDYKKWMQAQTDALVTAVGQYAREQTGKPITPLSTWRYDKEQLARTCVSSLTANGRVFSTVFCRWPSPP